MLNKYLTADFFLIFFCRTYDISTNFLLSKCLILFRAKSVFFFFFFCFFFLFFFLLKLDPSINCSGYIVFLFVFFFFCETSSKFFTTREILTRLEPTFPASQNKNKRRQEGMYLVSCKKSSYRSCGQRGPSSACASL